MSRENYIEIRENLNYIYSLVNEIINNYEMKKKNDPESQSHFSIDEAMLKFGEVSSVLQINIHMLDMLLSTSTQA